MRVLFVCVENSCRSQIAEAFARMHGSGVQAFSAGWRPSGAVDAKAVASMKEIGYDLSTHRSKSLEEIPPGTFDAVVTMGCGDACPWVPARRRVEWDIPDPKEMDPDGFRKVRFEIARRVDDLLNNR